MSDRNITVTQTVCNYLFEIILVVQNMHQIEIAYVSEKNIESNIQK